MKSSFAVRYADSGDHARGSRSASATAAAASPGSATADATARAGWDARHYVPPATIRSPTPRQAGAPGLSFMFIDADLRMFAVSRTAPRSSTTLRSTRAWTAFFVKLPGYLVPWRSNKAPVRECSAGPILRRLRPLSPPPPNQMVHVVLASPRAPVARHERGLDVRRDPGEEESTPTSARRLSHGSPEDRAVCRRRAGDDAPTAMPRPASLPL